VYSFLYVDLTATDVKNVFVREFDVYLVLINTGLNESTIKSLIKPCETCSHERNTYFLNNMQLDSTCSKFCEFPLKTNHHKEELDKDTDFESVQSENESKHD